VIDASNAQEAGIQDFAGDPAGGLHGETDTW